MTDEIILESTTGGILIWFFSESIFGKYVKS